MFLYNDKQINNIKRFCCEGSNPSVLPTDTTFNLCDLWITDTSYQNKRLINRESGKNPIFVGPKMFHFTKDEGALSRFVLELLAADPKLIELKNIGVNMESAIYQNFKNFTPSVNRLLSERHLKQGDEKKLDKLLNRLKLDAASHQQAKCSILQDIHRCRTGGFYEFGLIDAFNKDDFEVKLLQEKWNSLCLEFFGWFKKKRSDFFV